MCMRVCTNASLHAHTCECACAPPLVLRLPPIPFEPLPQILFLALLIHVSCLLLPLAAGAKALQVDAADQGEHIQDSFNGLVRVPWPKLHEGRYDNITTAPTTT